MIEHRSLAVEGNRSVGPGCRVMVGISPARQKFVSSTFKEKPGYWAWQILIPAPIPMLMRAGANTCSSPTQRSALEGHDMCGPSNWKPKMKMALMGIMGDIGCRESPPFRLRGLPQDLAARRSTVVVPVV